MKIKTFILSLLGALMCVSCGYKKQAREVTQAFFSAIKNDRDAALLGYYPNLCFLENYLKSDTIFIKDIKETDNNKYTVTLTNKYTNGFGKTTETDITIFTAPKDTANPSAGYIITDSKGLCSFKNDKIYNFAVREGIISGDSLTDFHLSVKYAYAKIKLEGKVERLKQRLQERVKIETWEWETSEYSSSASGSGVVVNYTDISIPSLKYKVIYKGRSGYVITEDDGYISYGNLEAKSRKSFTFYTPYVGYAEKATISVEFDEDFLKDAVLDGTYAYI